MTRVTRCCISLGAFGLFLLLPLFSFAQVSVTFGSPYDQYVNELDDGVNITNVNITCDTIGQLGAGPQMSKFFSAGGTVDLDSGLLMTSGSVDFAVPGAGIGVGQNLGGPSDPDLVNELGPGTDINDACVVTFDVFPTCDTIRFRYVFGSNEYPTFVGSFDDIFGAFISGPGYPTPTNFATLPGTTTAVFIGSVNAMTNSNFFVAAPVGTDYDGTTVVLTAKVPVDPCQTYSIKLAIADEGDDGYDSGVFIEALSCDGGGTGGGGGAGLVTSQNNNGTGTEVAEECVDGFFTVFNVLDTTIAVPLTLTYGGTATFGVDYTGPSSIIIPPNQSSIDIPITVIADGVVEGNETIQLAVGGVPCIGDDTATLTILDPFVIDAGNDTSFCSGDPGVIGSPSVPDVTYTWENVLGMQGPLDSSSPTVSFATPFSQTLFFPMTATNLLGCVDEDTITVEIVPLPEANFSMETDLCVGALTTVTFIGVPIPGATYTWDFGPNVATVQGTGAGPYQVSWNGTGLQTVSLVVADAACESAPSVQTITIHPIPTANFSLDPDACEGQNAQLLYTGSASPAASYLWDLDGGLPAVSGPGP
ncbi:MAG: choice-of-anchor L domain-containing protein, partial [Bacteroidota bacterium]